MDTAPILPALVGAVTGAIAAYVALRRDGRETRSAEASESDRTIGLLEKQNELLERQLVEAKKQGEQREIEWQERRVEWQRREKNLEKRIEILEQWQRDEISARRRLQMCRKAPDCEDYDAGDEVGTQ